MKHGVDFADAVVALEDENALTIEDRDHLEQRFKTLDMGSYMNVLLLKIASGSYRKERRIRNRESNILRG